VNTGINVNAFDIVRNNIIVDMSGWCMQATHGATDDIITNNTFLNCDRGGIVIGPNGLADYMTISNNIFANLGTLVARAGVTVLSSGCGPHNIYANNLMYGNVAGNYSFTGCSNTSTGTQSGSNLTTFVNYTGSVSGDYHLQAGSTRLGMAQLLVRFLDAFPPPTLMVRPAPKAPLSISGRMSYKLCEIPSLFAHKEMSGPTFSDMPFALIAQGCRLQSSPLRGCFSFLVHSSVYGGGVRWRITRFGLRPGAIGIRRRAISMTSPRLWAWVKPFVPSAKLLPS